MKRFTTALVSLLIASPLIAAETQPAGTLEQLLQRVKSDRVLERNIDKQREARFIKERDLQKQRLAAAQKQLQAEQARNEQLTETYDRNAEQLETLQQQLNRKSADLGELFGTVRQLAADSAGTLKSSMISAQLPGRSEHALRLADSKTLPSIDELETFWHAMLDEMVASGKVTQFDNTVITADGNELNTSVVRVGPFNAIANGLYLRYLPETARLVELPRQPNNRYLAMADALQNAQPGSNVDMALDPSRGAILALLTRAPNIWERVQQGGYIGYFILALGIIGLLIVLERFAILWLVGRKVRQQQTSLEQPNENNPLGRLLLTHAEHARQDAESLVLRLEEKIQQELPRLQRGLGVLVVIATIAPLLGLLGTVTGMIATFQSITLFGTGDPKLMSGGISQALVTTELGLVVAIPLMLLHTLLSGQSKGLVQVLDENSTALVASKVESNNA